MIHDAKVEVTCDGERCRDSIDIAPDWKFRNMSEHSGFYDCSDKAIGNKLKDEGWAVVGRKQYCEICKPENADDDD